MSNETTGGGQGIRFISNNEFLFMDCWSGDPDRAMICKVNTALGAIASLVLPIFMIGGFIGNSLTAYIYLWKLRPLTRQGVYFAMIGLSDSCNLFTTGFMWMFLAKGLPWISGAKYGFYIMSQSELACRVHRYSEMLFSLTSSTLFLIMVIDRCLSVYFPFRFQRSPAKSALKACLFVIVADVAATSLCFQPIHWVSQGIFTVCTFQLSGWHFWAFVMSLMLLFNPPTLPFLGILVANGFLIAKMRRIVLEQTELRTGSGESKLTNTVICVVLSVILIISSLPVEVFAFGNIYIMISGITVDTSISKLIWAFNDVGRMLILFNQSVNWLVLIWKSEQFREAFLAIFTRCCCKNKTVSVRSTPGQH